jgi:hypothetical protein
LKHRPVDALHMSQADEERTVVKTYVPRYQKERWRAHADDLDMSQSEFVRTMVQAGRRELGVEEAGSDPSDPGGSALESRVRETLADDPHLGWDDIHEELAADFADRLEETLQSMQERNEIEHSGRHGGYALADDE